MQSIYSQDTLPATKNQTNAAPATRPVTAKQLAALRKCVESKIAYYDSKGRRNKYSAAAIKILIVSSSVLTPILIGWKDATIEQVQLGNYALVSSAVAAGTTALYNFFDYKDLWTQYKVSRNELETILAELDYLEESGQENITQQQMELLFKSYVRVCADTNSFYRETRLAKDEADGLKK